MGVSQMISAACKVGDLCSAEAFLEDITHRVARDRQPRIKSIDRNLSTAHASSELTVPQTALDITSALFIPLIRLRLHRNQLEEVYLLLQFVYAGV